MTERQLRIHRLVVTYPEGSLEPGWEPKGWEPRYTGPEGDEDTFTWPPRHHYLSRTAAERRQRLLEGWGATVIIETSEPITWPEVGTPPDRSREAPHTRQTSRRLKPEGEA
jgi:hypothetical protein